MPRFSFYLTENTSVSITKTNRLIQYGKVMILVSMVQKAQTKDKR